MSKDNKEYGYEGEMAKSQLKGVMMHAKQLHDMLEPDTDLPEWVQSKITLAYDYIQTAADYMATELDEEASLQELSKGLLDRYELKNERDRERLASGLWYPKGEAGATEKQKKDSAKLDKRIAGRNLASMKTHPKVFDPKVTGRPGARVHATEEAPTNSAGGGAIDGIGVGPKGEPGVKPKAMKRYKDKNAAEAPKAGRKTLSLFMKGE